MPCCRHRRALLAHPGQHPVASALRPEEHHAQAARAQAPPRLLGVAVHGVDAGLAPPAQAERPQTIGDGQRAGLVRHEVAVEELDRVDRVIADEALGDAAHPVRVLGQPPPPIDLRDRAEVAGERAAAAGDVAQRPLAQVRADDVLLHVAELVVGERGEAVEAREGPVGVVMDAVRILPGQAGDGGGWSARALRAQPLHEGLLALAADHRVDEVRAQHDVGVQGREVAAPHHAQARDTRADGARVEDRASELVARHGGDGQHGAAVAPQVRHRTSGRVRAEHVAVHDRVIRVGELRAEREQGQGQAPPSLHARERVVEDDHALSPRRWPAARAARRWRSA